ncbi:MAG: peptidylprolyl isomerase [Planctomycetota bacterium]
MTGKKLEAVADGAVVGIYYTLKDEGGNVLDTNRKGGAPLAYLHGHKNIVPGLEKALTGAKKGEKVDAVVAPEDGYGQPSEDLLEQVPRSAFPPDAQVVEGAVFQGRQPNGQVFQARIAKVEGDEVTVDRNHPLAGQTLHFEVTVDGIREATEEELTHGHAHGAGGHQH